MSVPEEAAPNKGFLWPAEDVEAVIAELCQFLPERFHPDLSRLLRILMRKIGDAIQAGEFLPGQNRPRLAFLPPIRSASGQTAEASVAYTITDRAIRFHACSSDEDGLPIPGMEASATLLRWGL
ncbi:MAG: hypothetical protein MUD06_00195 [Rhodospirillales bacterium]|nr:hypothetical protein [Rhodospirillales bacterium]